MVLGIFMLQWMRSATTHTLHSSEPLRTNDSLQPPKHDLTIQWPVLSGCLFRTYLQAMR